MGTRGNRHTPVRTLSGRACCWGPLPPTCKGWERKGSMKGRRPTWKSDSKHQRFQFHPRMAHLPPSVRERRGLCPSGLGGSKSRGRRRAGGRGGASAEPHGLHPQRGSPKREARASGLPGAKMTSTDTTPGRFGGGTTANGLCSKGRARRFPRHHAAVRRRSLCSGAPGSARPR